MSPEAPDRVQQLLSEYVAAFKSGEGPSPLAYLDQLEGTDRAELEALIDGYLANAPGREFDPNSFAGSPAEKVAEGLTKSLTGSSGLWPALLPRLRERAQIKRKDLVERLAEALGATGKEQKVARYYHEMEQGFLPADRVSNKVLDALGSIVGESREALRKAGAAVTPSSASSEGVAFARTTVVHADHDPGEPPAPAAAGKKPERDEIDELFTGG
ncbi:MAG: hypothetical protein EXQ70_11495 [Solirubrobacterales bacterium]|nr:hypothetical protein [Solirubrobacterales bacterium]